MSDTLASGERARFLVPTKNCVHKEAIQNSIEPEQRPHFTQNNGAIKVQSTTLCPSPPSCFFFPFHLKLLGSKLSPFFPETSIGTTF